MLTRLLATLAALTTATATASAEVDDDGGEVVPSAARYVGVTSRGGVSDGTFRLGAGAEGGYRVADSSWFIHAQGETGITASSSASGRYNALRAGLEARRCAGFTSQLVCGFLGADAGVMHDSYTTVDEQIGSSEVAMVVPRAGIEAGTTVRPRAIVEAPLYGGDGAKTGVNVSLGVAYAF
jgi:hypothetical protein